MRTVIFLILLAVAASMGDAQWVQTNCPETALLTMADKLLYASGGGPGSGTLLRSTDNGNRWDTLSIWPDPLSRIGYWYQLISVDTILVAAVGIIARAGTGEFLIVRSTDGGHTWIDTTMRGEDNWVSKFLWMNSRLYAYMHGISIFSSSSRGATWDTVKQSGLPNDQLSTVLCKGPLVFCGTLNHGVFRSTSYGESWVPASVGLSSYYTTGLAFVGDTLFCLVWRMSPDSMIVFRSTNDGATWSDASSALSGSRTTGSGLWSHGNLVFAATNAGLFVSTNRGDSWSLWGEGLPLNPPYNCVASMAFSDSFAFALLGGRGVWRRPLSEIVTSVETVTSELRSAFSLEQNYPNPFNPVTRIKYQLSTRAYVTLKVFDILGREVATLVNEVKQPGTYGVQFDGSGLASGVCFYRIQAGDFVASRKLLLLK